MTRKKTPHDKGLEMALAYAEDIKGFEDCGRDSVFVECACPRCNLNYDFPLHFIVYQNELGEMRFKYHRLPRNISKRKGVKDETFFDEFWKLEYKYRFGKLEIEEKTKEDQFASLPDRYNRALRAHFEIKMKPSFSYQETLRTASKTIWLNKKSIDLKYKHSVNNKDELYVIVVFFYDKGYYVIEVSKIVKHCCSRCPPYSKDLVYEIPLSFLWPIKKFVENRSYLIERNI